MLRQDGKTLAGSRRIQFFSVMKSSAICEARKNTGSGDVNGFKHYDKYKSFI